VPGWRDLLDRSATGDQPERLPAADRPEPGSRADLRQRLDALSPDHPSSPRNADRGDTERDYWSQTSRFGRLWADHQARWPDERRDAAVDRSHDPEGSWRGSGNQYLSPEQHTRTEQLIAGVRDAEQTVSGHMREIEQDNASGSRLAGWGHRLKGDDRLKEKIAEKVEHEPGRTPAESLRGINDAVRYTFCSEPSDYPDAYRNIKGMLEERGYTMFYSKNHWSDDPDYKGINTRWATPEGHRFELQFHTPESLHAKQTVTHGCYERIRNPLTSDDERGELGAFQRAVSSWVSVPAQARTLPDHPKKGR
jgi:hypothetical protein